MTQADLIQIAEKFDKWLEDISAEYNIDKDAAQEIIKQILVG